MRMGTEGHTPPRNSIVFRGGGGGGGIDVFVQPQRAVCTNQWQAVRRCGCKDATTWLHAYRGRWAVIDMNCLRQALLIHPYACNQSDVQVYSYSLGVCQPWFVQTAGCRQILSFSMVYTPLHPCAWSLCEQAFIKQVKNITKQSSRDLPIHSWDRHTPNRQQSQVGDLTFPY